MAANAAAQPTPKAFGCSGLLTIEERAEFRPGVLNSIFDHGQWNGLDMLKK